MVGVQLIRSGGCGMVELRQLDAGIWGTVAELWRQDGGFGDGTGWEVAELQRRWGDLGMALDGRWRSPIIYCSVYYQNLLIICLAGGSAVHSGGAKR